MSERVEEKKNCRKHSYSTSLLRWLEQKRERVELSRAIELGSSFVWELDNQKKKKRREFITSSSPCLELHSSWTGWQERFSVYSHPHYIL